MSKTRTPLRNGRRPLFALLLGGFCLSACGCHQHHYYYGASSTAAGGYCPPGTTIMPSNISVGQVCDVPDVESNSSGLGARSTIVDDGRRSQVVVSEPVRRSRFGWRSTNPEDVPTITHVDGALNSNVK